ncbi:hypothetical protein [Xanthomonas axonopodis]|uniref:hypothetical protein n=1 Tax=Xanthomonas axonopodis TaxID=53413 RepID=UPI000B075B40|nr:hypothetical protein [Xanthomonas axonopodis]
MLPYVMTAGSPIHSHAAGATCVRTVLPIERSIMSGAGAPFSLCLGNYLPAPGRTSANTRIKKKAGFRRPFLSSDTAAGAAVLQALLT